MRDSDPQENRLEGVFRDLIGTDSDGSAVGRMCRWALVGRGEQAVLAGGILFMYNSRIVYKYTPQSRHRLGPPSLTLPHHYW